MASNDPAAQDAPPSLDAFLAGVVQHLECAADPPAREIPGEAMRRPDVRHIERLLAQARAQARALQRERGE